jgi:hypothetical protein
MYKHPPSGAASQSAALLTPHSYPYPYTLPRPLPIHAMNQPIVVQKNKKAESQCNPAAARNIHFSRLCNDVKSARGTANAIIPQASTSQMQANDKVSFRNSSASVPPPPKNKLPGFLVLSSACVAAEMGAVGVGAKKKCGTNAPPPFLVSH